MTKVEFAVLISVKSVLQYEAQRYESSLSYWTEGKGASSSSAKKSADFCRVRIDAINNALDQLEMLRPEQS